MQPYSFFFSLLWNILFSLVSRPFHIFYPSANNISPNLNRTSFILWDSTWTLFYPRNSLNLHYISLLSVSTASSPVACITLCYNYLYTSLDPLPPQGMVYILSVKGVPLDSIVYVIQLGTQVFVKQMGLYYSLTISPNIVIQTSA